jgi:hypothetical protein
MVARVSVDQRQVEPNGGDIAARQASPLAPGQAGLLATLQRSAGNAAVGRLLRAGRGPGLAAAARLPAGAIGNAATGRLLQRYEAYEHAKQGDHAAGSMTIMLPGTSGNLSGTNSLTSGEINALADLYASPEALEKADAVELAKLKALIKRQLAGQKVAESEWDDATGGRYNRLNLKNSAHFSPRNTALIDPGTGTYAGANNRENFVRYYSETIVNAQSAFNQMGLFSEEYKQKWLDRAVISAGFAEHFLMDAFSAGHLFNKDDFIAVLKKNLDALTKDERSTLFDNVAAGVLADPTSKALLGAYEPTERKWFLLGIRPNFDNQFAFKALLENLYDDPEGRQAVYSALVKVVHDELSTRKAGGGLLGVEVENDFEKWILSGDKTLDSSPKTQEIIDKAIVKFRELMAPYRKGTVNEPSSYAPRSEQVLAYFPRPTAATTAFISGRVKNVTDPRTGTAPALVDILQKELPSILSALVDRGRIKKA